jgi:toxin ParE1/3/4
MEIRWSPESVDDLEKIVAHIQKDNRKAAQDTGRKIYESISQLRQFPRSGRAGRIEGTRELVISSLPYLVVYRVKEAAVEVVRIFHAAQDWP